MMTKNRHVPAPDRLPKSGPRLWLMRLAVALLMPVAVLLALEGSLRLLGTGYPTDFALKTRDGDAYAGNLRFGWRFFPPAVARVPLLFSFPAEKPVDTYRVFVLGASAAQGYPSGAFSFARILEVMLEEAYPSTDFEVINTSITATNSHVVRPIAREMAAHDPDLFVVYLGNNEVIGPYGFGSSESGARGGLGLIRAGIRLRETRLGQAVHGLAAKAAGGGTDVEDWAGMEMFAEHHIARGDPRLDRVADAFAANLEDICSAAVDVGAAVLLSTVAVNDWDCAPFASATPDLSPADRAAWETAFAEGAAAEQEGRAAEAVAAFSRAVDLDDAHAELRYRLGRSLLAVGDTVSAGAHVMAARDLDLLRFRTDTRLNDVIRATAAADGVRLVDAALRFRELGPDLDRPRLERRFFEHVHFTFRGNHRLARVMLPEVAALLPEEIRAGGSAAPTPLDLEACADALNYTPWDAYRSLQTIGTLLQEHPFPGRYDHEQLVREWGEVFTAMREGMTRAEFATIVGAYEKAVAARPDDLLLRADFAALLKEIGRGREASAQWRLIEATQPPSDWSR